MDEKFISLIKIITTYARSSMNLMRNVNKSIIRHYTKWFKNGKSQTVIIEFTIDIRSLKKVQIYETIGL